MATSMTIITCHNIHFIIYRVILAHERHNKHTQPLLVQASTHGRPAHSETGGHCLEGQYSVVVQFKVLLLYAWMWLQES